VGQFETGAAEREELVVGVLDSETLEIHCHGGAAAASAILDALASDGYQVLSPEAWLNEVEAEALTAAAALALAAARTPRTASYLLDQYRGALSAAMAQIEDWLRSGERERAENAVQELLDRAAFGLHLTKAWSIVLAGRPNAGKSSLMNAVLGFERSIVFEEPGTTRDVLIANTALDGWPVEIRDTAGLRAAGHAIEAEGVERAKQEIAEADLVLFIADNSAPWDAEIFAEVVGLRVWRPSPGILVVHNKVDLAGVPTDGRPTGLAVSAQQRVGIEALCELAARTLTPVIPPRGSAIPFTEGQVQQLHALLRRARSERP
jgi:tRNA modification GTPase